MEDEPLVEPEISKETLKERILAIQKGLDYAATKPSPPHPRRAESHSEADDVDRNPSSESVPGLSVLETEAQALEMPQGSREGVGEDRDSAEGARTTTDTEDIIGLSKVAEAEEPSAPDVDPEIARRIAIRERMAKMSGGMGMHMAMAMGPPSAFSKPKTQIKIPSSSSTNGQLERQDPIPIIPGLPSIMPKGLEREVGTSSPIKLRETGPEVSPSDVAPRIDPLADTATEAKGNEVERLQRSRQSLGSDLGDDDINESPLDEGDVHEYDNSDDRYELGSPNHSSDDEIENSAEPYKTGDIVQPNVHPGVEMSSFRQPSSDQPNRPMPSIPVSPSFGEISSHLPRPPPPPLRPPVPTAPLVSPPPIPRPVKFQHASKQLSVSSEHDFEESDEDRSSIDSNVKTFEQDTHSRDGSPISPTSRPPPPPLPQPPFQSKPLPVMYSKPPPIPTTPRNLDLDPYIGGAPSSGGISASGAAEQHTSAGPRHHDDPPSTPPPLPASPTSTSFRRTQSDRQSLDLPRGRNSVDVQRRDEAFISMREENIQDGRQWWLDAASPPYVFRNRSDLTFEVEDSTATRRGGHASVVRNVYILFSDYSQTIVTAQYDRDDPSNAILNQRHLPPPAQPTKAELEARHEQIGHQIVALAQAKLGLSVGDGSAIAVVQELFSKLENCLPSAGVRSHGALIYSNIGNSFTKQFDEIRPGDIATFKNSVFQSHGGLRGKVVTEVGKPDHVAVIQEWNGTKKKLKVFEQRQESKRVAHNSYKIGELRSGEVHIFRPMPRSWVNW